MAPFTSNRERRLWLWTVAVVVGIYATLGLARTLADALGDSGFLDPVLFSLGMLLVLAAVVMQGVQRRPRGVEVGILLGVAAVYLMVFTRMASPVERSHLIEYGVVALFVYTALTERASQGRHVPAPALLAILLTTLIGAVDECIQLFLPSRVFDPIDILFNTLAAVMAVGASVVLHWARARW